MRPWLSGTSPCSAGGGWTSLCSPGFSPLEKLPSRRPLLSLEISPRRQGRCACPAGRDIPHTHKTGTSSAGGRNGRCRSPPALRPRLHELFKGPVAAGSKIHRRSPPFWFWVQKSGVVFSFRCVTIGVVGFTGK